MCPLMVLAMACICKLAGPHLQTRWPASASPIAFECRLESVASIHNINRPRKVYVSLSPTCRCLASTLFGPLPYFMSLRCSSFPKAMTLRCRFVRSSLITDTSLSI